MCVDIFTRSDSILRLNELSESHCFPVRLRCTNSRKFCCLTQHSWPSAWPHCCTVRYCTVPLTLTFHARARYTRTSRPGHEPGDHATSLVTCDSAGKGQRFFRFVLNRTQPWAWIRLKISARDICALAREHSHFETCNSTVLA